MNVGHPTRLLGLLALLGALVLAGCGGRNGPNTATTPPVTLAPGAGAPLALAPEDWPTYGHDAARSANSPGETLGLLHKTWTSPNLDGSVYGSPLVVGDEVIVATEGDSVYGLDSASGRVRWRSNLGAPVSGEDLPCGNISPLGITSTPVVDPGTGLVFVVAETEGPRHDLVGLDARTGQVRLRRNIDPPGSDPSSQLQRAALTLNQGHVYVPFGGLLGDCGRYNGYLVSLPTSGQGEPQIYKTPDDSKGAIWAPGGATVDETSTVFAATGNSTSEGQPFDYGNSVLRLTGDLGLQDFFAPTDWARLNDADSDLGSTGPALIPGGLIAQVGKPATAYLLRRDHLGGVGGQLASAGACQAFGGTAVKDNVLVFGCTSGLRAMSVNPGPTLATAWQGPPNVTGTPTIVGDALLALDTNAGALHGLDLASGRERSPQVDVGAVTRFASISVSRGQAFVPTQTGVVAVGLR